MIWAEDLPLPRQVEFFSMNLHWLKASFKPENNTSWLKTSFLSPTCNVPSLFVVGGMPALHVQSRSLHLPRSIYFNLSSSLNLIICTIISLPCDIHLSLVHLAEVVALTLLEQHRCVHLHGTWAIRRFSQFSGRKSGKKSLVPSFRMKIGVSSFQ